MKIQKWEQTYYGIAEKDNKRYTTLSGPLEIMYSDQVLQGHDF
jgi:hypothetical protein